MYYKNKYNKYIKLKTMKKFLVILTVVLANVLNINATEVNTYKINYDVINKLVDSNKNFKMFNDSILKNNNDNFAPVYKFLKLKDYQYEEFYRIHKDVSNTLVMLNKNKENGVDTFYHHINIDLKNGRSILNENQYRDYVKVLNITIANRGLRKYLK